MALTRSGLAGADEIGVKTENKKEEPRQFCSFINNKQTKKKKTQKNHSLKEKKE